MKEQKDIYLDFRFTGDGSVGLYNNGVQDIYHSSYGAKKEAKEKFIEPLDFNNNFSHKKELKILDICFGIGYNTKALLEKLISTNYQGRVEIDILEYDKSLALISTFLKDGFFKKSPEISYILTREIMNEIYKNKDAINKLMGDKDCKKFIEPYYVNLIKIYRNLGYTYDPLRQNKSFLHNIYYHCISQRNKKPPNLLKINKFKLNVHFDDARTSVQRLAGDYDIIFLDAFTPTKLPTLWSLQFFMELHRLSSDDSILVTYSNSSAVRHAMIESGFCVGKIYDKKNKNCGTIASKNSAIIKNELDDYDLGLMKTNAGVYFIDKDLNSSPEEMIDSWKRRKDESDLQSSSSYIKKHKREHGSCLNTI